MLFLGKSLKRVSWGFWFRADACCAPQGEQRPGEIGGKVLRAELVQSRRKAHS